MNNIAIIRYAKEKSLKICTIFEIPENEMINT